MIQNKYSLRFYNEQMHEKYQGWKNNYLGFVRLTNYKQTGDINTNLVPSYILLNHTFL
jgi:hypothetical protein